MGVVSLRCEQWRNCRSLCGRSKSIAVQSDYGGRCPQCIDSVQFVTQISGQYTSKWFLNQDTLAVSKNSGKTSLIERFNCTLRQRVSRLVRDTWSFSKKLDNHIGAIWYARRSLQSILTFVGLPLFNSVTSFKCLYAPLTHRVLSLGKASPTIPISPTRSPQKCVSNRADDSLLALISAACFCSNLHKQSGKRA